MKLTKLTIFMIAVVAIGIFALPMTLSVGVGQHKFRTYGTVETNGSAFCGQCHKSGDTVANELLSSDTRDAGNALLGYGAAGSKIHSTQWCGDCHAITSGYETARTSANVEHAAKNPSCLKCHGSGSGFNDVTVELGRATESHKAFNSTTDDDIQCIGCHTYVTKTGTVTYTFDTSAGITVKGLTFGP